MKARFIEKQDTKVKFEIAESAEDFENALLEAYKATKDQFRIDGFRKGKAPRKLIMQHYGEKIFDDDAIESLLQKDYPAALLELGVEPIDRPAVDIPELKHGEGFTVTVTVEVPPEFEVKDFEGVKIKEIAYPVSDADIDDQLEEARTRSARHVASADHAAEEGDTVNIDYSGSVDGVKFEGGTDTGHNLKLGSHSFIDGFEEQLVGCKTGDELNVKVTFPSEYHAEPLAGKEAVFACKVNEVRIEEKPELNDEFAQDISEFDTLDELRADIRVKMEEHGKARAEMEMKDAILEKIYESNEIEVPEVMVEDQLQDMLKDFEREIKQQGFQLEQYFQLSGQAPNEVREQIKIDAYKRVRMKLIVQNIVRMQGIGVSDAEREEELTNMAAQYGMESDKLRDILGGFQLKLLEDDIKSRKAVDYIYANAVMESE